MDALRNFLKSRLGIALLALTLAPMAFLSMSGGLGGGGSRLPDQVVTIGKQGISLDALQSAMNNSRNQLTSRGVDSSLIKEDILQKEVLNEMIEQIVLEQQAGKLGLGVSDEAITKMLVSQEGLQDADGKFSNDLFANYLRRNNLTKDKLFAQLRVQLAIEQFSKGILNTAIYPMSAIDILLDMQLETRHLWLYRFPWQDFTTAVTVSDADIETYYNQHTKDLVSVPMVDLSYIRLTAEDIKLPEITDEELQAEYTRYQQQNDSREFSQILLEGDDAEAKAKEVKAKLDAGESFDSLLKAYEKNGSGAIGRLNAEVFGDDATEIFSQLSELKIGDISQPIKTSYGYQIFTVTSDNQAKMTLDSVKEQLIETINISKRQNTLNDKISTINELAADGFGLQDIAEQEGITVQTIKDYQKENNLSDLSQPAVIKKAFDEFTLQDESVTTGINIDESTVWLQPSNYRASQALTLEEAKSQIKDILVQQKATDVAINEANKFAKSIQSVSDITKQPIKLTEVGVVNRQQAELLDAEKRIAFAKSAPTKASNTVLTQVTKTDTGASIVITQAVDADNPVIDDTQKSQQAMAIRTAIGQEQSNDYIDYLKTIANIEINQDKIDAANQAHAN